MVTYEHCNICKWQKEVTAVLRDSDYWVIHLKCGHHKYTSNPEIGEKIKERLVAI